MTATNWNSTVHLEVKKALEKDIIPIITHIYARIIHFEQDFVKEAAEFLGDYKSLEKEADVKADLLKRLVLLQKDFEKLEAHNISLELQFPNQSLTLGPSELFLKESSDVANVKKDIDDNETINSELEHNVAALLKNKDLKQTYKEFYDSIKKTRAQTKDHIDFLIVQLNSKTIENADLISHLQDKTFANSELQKIIKGKNMNTNFVKPSILGKSPSSKPLINSPLSKLRFPPKLSWNKFCQNQSLHNLCPSKQITLSRTPMRNELTHHYYLDQVRIRATRLQDLVDQAFASCPLADHDKQSKEIESKP
ncbi:hypothetical protein Tco_1284938 [Tanacetum coccineum]